MLTPHEAAQRGRRVEFHVTVKAIDVVTLPALNDDFAARLTKDEEPSLTLLQLRMRIRENYQRSLEDQYRRDYMGRVLDAVTEGAMLKYPEAIVADQIEDMIKDFDQRLRQRNITLQDYMKIYNVDLNALYDQYRPSADRMVRRGLVVRALVDAEKLQIDEARVLTAIDSMFNTGDDQQRQQLRQLVMQNADYLNEIRSDVLRDQVFDRLYAIARGETVGLPTTPAEALSDTSQSNDNPDENQQEEPSE